jgi:hypothetical protein
MRILPGAEAGAFSDLFGGHDNVKNVGFILPRD